MKAIDEKVVMLETPVKFRCNSLVQYTTLIGVYKVGKSFRAFDEWGNWFTVSTLGNNARRKCQKAIEQYNTLYSC